MSDLGAQSGTDATAAGADGPDEAVNAICLVVPSGAWNLEPLVAAIRVHHGDRSIVAVWCGDPHLRPVLPDSTATTWCDRDLDEPSGAGWNRLLVGLAPRTYEWARAAAAIGRLLDAGVHSVVMLRVGSVAVLGDLAPLTGDLSITLVPRANEAMPADGLAPSEADLISAGRHSVAVAGYRDGAQPALRWLIEQLLGGDGEVGPWVDRMAELFGSGNCASVQVVAGGWPSGATRDGVEQPIALLDLDHLDRNEPWHFDLGQRPARVRLSADPTLAAAIIAGWPQCEGDPAPVLLPGGIPASGPIRSLMHRELNVARRGDSALPPEPYGPHNSTFTRWLEQSERAGADVGRYWIEVRALRPDLQAEFPQPQAADAARLLEWTNVSWRLEQRTAILRCRADATFAAPGGDPQRAVASAGFEPSGINVLGYLDFDQGQGDVARRIIDALRAASVPVAALGFHRSDAPRRAGGMATDGVARYATNLAVVTAAHFDFVAADLGVSLLAGRHTIGYWFWELEHVPSAMVKAIDHVDEIWAGSRFVADAFAAVTDKPVHCVPIPVAEPQPSDRNRAGFGLPADPFVFLCTFDQFSVPERKNPFGVIDAFTTAFADGEGPLLWIKTMNGDRGWRNHERLLVAAARRSDIIVWDEHLARADQMAVLNTADCLVSLHRSEGLGLHCAESMWLGKPVIATRYSGNLDFMDDSCAALVGYDMVPVRHGEGIYPSNARWADPHIDEAVVWMRRLATDPALAAELGARARARMQSQTSAAETGLLMARLACLQPTRG